MKTIIAVALLALLALLTGTVGALGRGGDGARRAPPQTERHVLLCAQVPASREMPQLRAWLGCAR